MVTLLGTYEYDTPAKILLMMLIYITNIICTLDIRKSRTYLGYVTGAKIRRPTSDVYILVHVILLTLAMQSKVWVCGYSLAGIVG